MLNDTTILYELPRDIPTNELVGRKFFRDLTKWIPELRLDSDIAHEEQYWGEYVMRLPYPLDVLAMSDHDIQLVANSVNGRHTLAICFKHQDPNNTTLPLRSRTILQHLISQVKAQNGTEKGTETD